MKDHRAPLLDFFLIIFIFLFSLWFQFHSFLNWDAGWHIVGAERMLKGGASYSTNLFDDNLPMVFWFFIPLVSLHTLTGISIITLTIIAVHLLVLLSFLLCNVYLKVIYTNKNTWEMRVIRYAFLITLLFFPGGEFAQRDMLVVLFSFPYVFLMAAQMSCSGAYESCLLKKASLNKQVSQTLSLGFCVAVQGFIGFLMSIAIAMNPFYGLIFLALEIQLYCSMKKVLWKRPECVTFLITIFLYFLIMGIAYTDYFTNIIPSFLVFSESLQKPKFYLPTHYPSDCMLFASLVFLMVYKIISRRQWAMSLWLSMMVGYVIYLVNAKSWPSHLIYFMDISVILFIVIIFQINRTKNKYPVRYCIGTLIIFYCLLIPLPQILKNNLYTYSQNKNPDFSLNQLISFFNRQKGNSTLYVLSTQTAYIFPAVTYADVNYLSSGPNSWGAPAIAQADNGKFSGWRLRWIQQYKKSFIKTTVLDLQVKKPRFIIINTTNKEQALPFSFLEFLNKNAAFRKQWKNYQHCKTIHEYQIYQRKGSDSDCT